MSTPPPFLSVTESMLMTALRTVLLTLIPGATIIQGYQNRVAMPTGATVTLTSLRMTPLCMTFSPTSSWLPGTVNPGTEGNQRAEEWVCQIDVFGPGASDSARLVNLLVRSNYACEAFAALTPAPLVPLFAGTPAQFMFVNDSNQYEPRWMFEFHAQFNPVVETPLDFANTLAVELVDVDARFPPET